MSSGVPARTIVVYRSPGRRQRVSGDWALEPSSAQSRRQRSQFAAIEFAAAELRRALGDREGQRLETRNHAYALRVETGEVDLDRFDELVREGAEALERGRTADAAARLREGQVRCAFHGGCCEKSPTLLG
jgi:hypothetical protein